jgi:predicted ArsR family transcriptional regulator
MANLLRQQLLDTTRGRIVALLRSGGSTADDLATRLGVSRSAVRVQLTAMERDGVVFRAGKKRGTTRPSYLFGLTPESEQLLSTAYVPFLTALVGVLDESLAAEQLQSVLRGAGRRLAKELSRGSRLKGDLRSRVVMASELLNTQLGALTRVESNGHYWIRSSGCPLAALTARCPSVCLAISAMLGEVIGAPVRECCERDGQPRCRFEIRKTAGRSGTRK